VVKTNHSAYIVITVMNLAKKRSTRLMSVKGKQSNGVTTTGGNASRSETNTVVMLSFLNFVFHKSNHMQEYADIYLLQSHSTCFGCHSTHHQEYLKL